MSKIQELKDEIEDLTIHLADMLEAALVFAGVSEDNLEKAVKIYIQSLDDIFSDDEQMSYKEIVKAIEHIKANHPNLFR